MVRSKNPRKIGNISRDQIKGALEKIRNGMTIRKTSDLTGIPFTTLRRYNEKTKDCSSLEDANLEPNYSVNKIFDTAQENLLKDYFTYGVMLSYGLSTNECRRIAYQMARLHNLKMPDSWKKKEMAGKDWFKSFKSRYPELSLRKPEPSSLARATAFNRENVEKFYENLENLMKKSSTLADGSSISNLNKTSTTTVQKPQKVIAKESRKSLSKVTSDEKETLETI